MKTNMDSVSYAIGADIGANLKRSKMDSLNVDIMAVGLRDGLDSTVKIDEEKLRVVMEGFMAKMQGARQAEEMQKADGNRAAGEAYLAENAKRQGVVTTPSGLQYEVMTMGTGPKPTAADQVKVHYTGALVDGTVFDSSVERGEPAVFGVGQVIPGWVEGLQLMPTGSKWKLFIPSDLAYGPSGGGGKIPGNSVLVFDVELLEIVK
ncbi:MAG: FKBP-type peptidyl-prolyl cis-trans isomerase [Flavobacteriales bacterium]|nr:FKBP-type peptidyl-prolyl cis-trans isomerase [Flavobacteriales bacterium]MBP7154659.1 FKBP-type peptidyl-prolyl cis-trans isomerase [Flavobacteriales bacterium]HQV73898.1 FKBP-type peptidyl-prolyl cis-trans isomerase [Flavobacteriales bacterium]HQW39770.1 FKBP-type peptidyl-prolyl cis-trans isomerase [Flavobacteriales bacterium]